MRRVRWVILGGGTVGINTAPDCVGMDARTVIMDGSQALLCYLNDKAAIEEQIVDAGIVVGGVVLLLHGT